jgi:hypothetical protein
MRAFLISYDLGSPESSSDYQRITDYIKSNFDYVKPLYSQYLVATDKSTATVRDELKGINDSNDKILVIDVTGDGWASINLPSSVTDWMKAKM